MAITLGRQRTKAQVLESVKKKLDKVDNQKALEILDKVLDKPGMDKKLIKYQYFL
jgi:hypothetical protein